MNFNDHSNLVGQHAFLGASKFHWLNYDEETLIRTYKRQYATTVGTILHELASDCIKNRIRLSKNADRHLIQLELIRNKIPAEFIDINSILETLVPFVNDAIGFGMTSELVLYYSENCFGTADTLSFKNNFLRIHDYKSGTLPTHMEQLLIYAALFCLEYKIKPFNIESELRIYQGGEILYHRPQPEEIMDIYKKIIESDNIIAKINSRGVSA